MNPSRPRHDLITRLWPVVSLWILIAGSSLFGLLGASVNRTVSTMLINLIIVTGLYTFVGLSGVFSFGHIGFAAVGAYVFAFAATPPETKATLLPNLPAALTDIHLPTLPSMLLAGLAAALVGLVVAVPLMRMNGLSAALGTLIVLIVINQVARNWRSVTNGTAGFPAVPVSTTTVTTMVWALLFVAAVFGFQQSRYGLRLKATRNDEIAAAALAINVPLERGRAFVLSAFICGIAGALSAALLGAFGPANFYIELTFLTLVMLVIGGIGSLAGAVVGTLVVSLVSELLRRLEKGIDVGPITMSARPGLRELALAGILLLILIVRPSGLMGGREITWPFGTRSRAMADPPPPPTQIAEPAQTV
jgi:branched-chain amino acid transport system permease protein